jgi:transcription elongation factor Elf1
MSYTDKCPVCSCCTGAYYREVNEYKIFKCYSCGLEYTLPVPSDEELYNYYKDYKDMNTDTRIRRLNASDNLLSLKAYGWEPSKRVLDFGCGEGDFVDAVGRNCFGIDIGMRMTEVMFSFITLFGVLEHLARPVETITELAKQLLPSGKIVLTTVDAESVIPYCYKPIEHLTYWTKSAMERMSQSCGLNIIEYCPYKMYQYGKIYLDKLLSRTPAKLIHLINSDLPEIVRVPTNEVFCVMEKP